jgi:glycosyltransferase involved in cell wall biosynthesis
MQVKAPIEFKIFGPKEDITYWVKCQALIASLPDNIKAVYCGSIEHDQVKKIVSEHDIFFVPTRGENFGHVFMESFSAGVPVLVSDQTPWRDLEGQGIGWDISLEQPKLFVKVIEDAARLSSVQRYKMKQQCLIFARKKAEDPTTQTLNRTLFSCALAAGR